MRSIVVLRRRPGSLHYAAAHRRRLSFRCTSWLARAGGAQPRRGGVRTCVPLRCSRPETPLYARNPRARRRPTRRPQTDTVPLSGRPATHLHNKLSRAPSHEPSRRRRARRRDPHLRGGPGRRPQPPAHDGELCRRQGQEGRDLRRVCRGRRRYRAPRPNSVAQWIAYQTSNLGVAGSSPVGVGG